MYTPVNIAAELRMMNVELQKLIASTTNASIRYRNSKITDLPAAYQPLLKTVSVFTQSVFHFCLITSK